jgi:hypothetical protein
MLAKLHLTVSLAMNTGGWSNLALNEASAGSSSGGRRTETRCHGRTELEGNGQRKDKVPIELKYGSPRTGKDRTSLKICSSLS